ncbi:hypothetical protein [Brachybacterium sacelli]|uniref:hypothetical protein n=1 Tax=Brachybacterium sacelli TaxID=173364 RepID=UPI003615AC37
MILTVPLGTAYTDHLTRPPVPFDLDGDVARNHTTMSLKALQYAIVHRTLLETGGIEVPEPAHRINVVVPVLTLMGLDDAPATYDGVTPLPAQMARRLAAGQKTWYRILTDPTSGQFLPVPADQYRPTAAMVEHLRVRDPVCAAPGCSRSTSRVGQNDHIEEFDHAHPARGGPTSIDNLHRMDFGHHETKTAKQIDPVRHADGSTTWSIGVPERARITLAPRRDLLTPTIAKALSEAWDHYQWLLDIDAYERTGQIDQFLREGGPEDPLTTGEDPHHHENNADRCHPTDPPF